VQVCTPYKRLGENDEPKMKEILDLLSGDRLFALVRVRQISLGDEVDIGQENAGQGGPAYRNAAPPCPCLRGSGVRRPLSLAGRGRLARPRADEAGEGGACGRERHALDTTKGHPHRRAGA